MQLLLTAILLSCVQIVTLLMFIEIMVRVQYISYKQNIFIRTLML